MTKFLLVSLFLIGFFLRIWRIDKVPIELFGDEIDVGLQAYSILTTGNDYLGNKLPIMFHSFSEYRLPMQLYLAVPSIALFGLNEIGVRTPAVLMGILSIFSLYLLVKELFGRRIALISALFMTVSPWHFNFARQANDAGILVPFVIFATYCFLKGRKEFKYLIFSAISFSLSIYTYAISAVFVPLFVFGLTIIFRKQIFSYPIKKLAQVFILCVIILAPYIYNTFAGITTRRVSHITLTTQREIEGEVVKSREFVPGFFGRLYYNKATVIFSKLFENYTQAISPTFLFSKGDPNPRHSVSGFGQMYFFDFAFVLLGLYLTAVGLIRDKDPKAHKIFLLWLVIAPLASIVTRGGGTHAARLILMLPPLITFSALGFNYLLEYKKPLFGKIFLVFVLSIMIFEVSKFMNHYFLVWSKESWRFWNYGFKDTLSFVKGRDEDFERIIFNNTYEPMLPRFLFWYGYDMQLFQKQFEGDVHIPEILPSLDGFKLEKKYYFGDLKKPIENLAREGDLIVASGEKDVTNPDIFDNLTLKLHDVFLSPTGIPIFYVYSSSANGN